MLGWILLMAVTVSHAPCFVDITGKAAVIPVCSTAACGSLFACRDALTEGCGQLSSFAAEAGMSSRHRLCVKGKVTH